MAQKLRAEKLAVLLQLIDPQQIADEGVRKTMEVLLNLVEQLNSKVKQLEEENQKLRDENNRLKGEQGKPDIKANKNIGLKKDHSSEKERKNPKKHSKASKNESIKIDREEIVVYPKEKLPADAQFKGYEEVVVQDILLKSDNVLFRKQKYYSSRTGKTYIAPLPTGYEGEFGSGIKAFLLCDDAPQFKLITSDLALCWVHEGRHYKKLTPLVPCHQKLLDDFLERFWNYYRKLLAYRDSPSQEKAYELELEFWTIFTEKTGYEQLDERKRLTALKVLELLLVLEHPELPLHNNPAELAARTMVQRRNISYATQTQQGTPVLGYFYVRRLTPLASWVSAFLSIFATAFPNLKIFHLWRQLFGRNLLLIPLVGHGWLNNSYPEVLRGYRI
ncbi:MAG: transposase [Rivularia sp. (in: cyanobacteria)]